MDISNTLDHLGFNNINFEGCKYLTLYDLPEITYLRLGNCKCDIGENRDIRDEGFLVVLKSNWQKLRYLAIYCNFKAI